MATWDETATFIAAQLTRRGTTDESIRAAVLADCRRFYDCLWHEGQGTMRPIEIETYSDRDLDLTVREAIKRFDAKRVANFRRAYELMFGQYLDLSIALQRTRRALDACQRQQKPTKGQ